MDLLKLTEELNKATAERADKELDRMIKLHEEELAKSKEAIKRYLANMGMVPGKIPDYTTGNGDMASWARNTIVVELLTNLKKELQ